MMTPQSRSAAPCLPHMIPPCSTPTQVARTLNACPDALLDDGMLDLTLFMGSITEQVGGWGGLLGALMSYGCVLLGALSELWRCAGKSARSASCCSDCLSNNVLQAGTVTHASPMHGTPHSPPHTTTQAQAPRLLHIAADHQ